MRLIDADRLLNPGYTDMFDEPIEFDMISRYAIESEPTVEAIPIEWIKKWCGDEPYWSNLAMHLIEDWEKENETN